MTKVCICGGGSLAHVCAGVLSSQPKVEVNIFTWKPELWSVKDLHSNVYKGNLTAISNNPKDALEGCDIVFLCLPGFAIESTLESIKPYVGNAVVGSIVCSTGFFLLLIECLVR